MRTTITLASDVNAAVEEVMRRRGVGRSEAVNELIRAALLHCQERGEYVPQTHAIGLRVDVANVGDVLDLMDRWDTGAGGPTSSTRSADAGLS
jgi:hypothetical protein